MNQLAELSRPTVGISDLIKHVNEYVRRYGSGEFAAPFWTGSIVAPTEDADNEFVSIRLASNRNLSLIHSGFRTPGPAELVTTLSDGHPIRVPIQIETCSGFRSNWHRSLAAFRCKNLRLFRWKSAEAFRLVRDAKRMHRDSRTTTRASYHCPAVISPQSCPVTAYVRDISEKGIGFLHPQPIESGPAAVDVYPGHKEEPIRIHIQITWCDRSIDVGYRSGGYFVDMAE